MRSRVSAVRAVVPVVNAITRGFGRKCVREGIICERRRTTRGEGEVGVRLVFIIQPKNAFSIQMERYCYHLKYERP